MAESETTADGKAYRWYVVLLLTVAYIFSFIDRQILSLLIEQIKHDLAISDTQFSLLSGFAFSSFYATMGLPIAYLADRFSRVRIISVGIAFWSMATIACGLSRNFVQMLVTRIGVGAGEAALTPATYSMLSDMFPPHRLGRAIGTYSVGAFLGGALAFLIGGSLIELLKGTPIIALPLFGALHSWQIAFLVVGAPGILISLLVLATVREPRQGNTPDKSSIGDGLRFVRSESRTFLFLFGGFSFFSMCQYALMNWTAAIYIRKFGLSAAEAGYLLGTILLFASTTGAFCGGWLIDVFLRREHKDAAMLSGIVGAACMVPTAIGAATVSDLRLSVALLVPALFFASFPLATSAAAIQVLTPKHLRAQAASLFLLCSNMIGLGIGNTLVALVTDRYFGDSRAVDSSVAIVVAMAGSLCLALLGIGRKHYRRSLPTQSADFLP